MKNYVLITAKQWQEYQKQKENDSPFSSISLSSNTITEFNELRPVYYDYRSKIDEIVEYCVKHQDECKNLYPTLEALGLYYGRNTYNKDDKKFSAALKEAIESQRAILFEMPTEYHSGLLQPANDVINSKSNRTPRKLTPDEVKAYELEMRYGKAQDNYIELTVYNLANQPFTIFDNASQKMLKQGTLDNNGYAYVSLPINAKYVDIVFDKQQEDRPWYYDIPLQILGGIRDAAQSVSDLSWDTSPTNLIMEYGFNVETQNPIQLGEVPEPETISGALTRGVSQFLIGFIPVSRTLKFIKPISKMGELGKGAIAGGITDFTVFAPHEERLSNLVQSFKELQNPVTEYLQADPDDSAAEGRLKNVLEGLLIGGLAEPFAHSLRALKYSRIKWMISDVRTRVHYKLKIVTIETESGSKGNWNELLNNPEPNTRYIVDGNKIYDTDHLGRVVRVEATLKLDTLDRNTYQQLKAGKQGIDGDEGGHLIASMLNGSGEKINLLPMNSNLNRSLWKKLENGWYKSLQEGKTVKVKIVPLYEGTDIRPHKFEVSYSFDNKGNFYTELYNKASK
ncbi:DNA/RNA non-specific endonuclease [Frischella perrara]|uniref:DNA/RNA non-specific endonuclease n=1 Tax=Frischella perrara TaxID=1267021 RepID=A0A0A7S0X9_FRIPE|nr:DNA/RNA non-specific endonuclease [Frischella perrara]AJA44482.1 DNA/RNA non-specific endonuclease [Frischella perrara]